MLFPQSDALQFKMKLKKIFILLIYSYSLQSSFSLLLFKYTYLFKSPATVHKYLKSTKYFWQQKKKKKIEAKVLRFYERSYLFDLE